MHLLSTANVVKETPEPFPLPTEASVVKAAAGWAHCVSVTGTLSFQFLIYLVINCNFQTLKNIFKKRRETA